MNIIATIENDLTAAWQTVETDAEKFGAILWADAKGVILAVQPAVYADLRKVIVGVLTAFEGRDLADVETAIMNVLQLGRSALAAEAEALGSNLLQLIISLVKAQL